MTVYGWAAWAVIVVAFVVIAWGLRADRRDYEELTAQLDELAGDYHSPADRLAAVEGHLDALVEHVTDAESPPTGRHAATGEQRALPQPG